MAKLKDRYSINDMKDLCHRFNQINYDMTHYKTREAANSDSEHALHSTIDYLVRVANMLSMTIQEELEGDVVTSDPMYYIKAKLNVAEQSVKSYHRLKKINLDED
jgi:hypothetical protein